MEFGADEWGADEWLRFYQQVAEVLREVVGLDTSYCTDLPLLLMGTHHSCGEHEFITRTFDGELRATARLVYLAPYHRREDLLPLARLVNKRLLRLQPGDGTHLPIEMRYAYLDQIALLRASRYLSEVGR